LLLATLQKFFHEEDDCLGCVKCFFYADADLNHFVSIFFYYNHGLRYDDEYKEAYFIRFDEGHMRTTILQCEPSKFLK
jgi:hypothetical protein